MPPLLLRQRFPHRQQVTERLREAEAMIPAGMGKPELTPVTTGLGEIYQYILIPPMLFIKKTAQTYTVCTVITIAIKKVAYAYEFVYVHDLKPLFFCIS